MIVDFVDHSFALVKISRTATHDFYDAEEQRRFALVHISRTATQALEDEKLQPVSHW